MSRLHYECLSTLHRLEGRKLSFIPMPNGISLCFDFTTAGQNWQFCLNLRKSAGAPTDSDLANVCSTADGWWDGTFNDLVTDSTTLRQIRATDMTAQGAPQHVLSVIDAGTDTNVPLPLGTAYVVSLRTAKRGRSYRGRIYVGGQSGATQTDEVTMTSSRASELAAAFLGLATSLDSGGFDVVVPSRMHNGVITNPAELNEVTAYVVDQKMDSQRRRLAGRGT